MGPVSLCFLSHPVLLKAEEVGRYREKGKMYVKTAFLLLCNLNRDKAIFKSKVEKKL